MKRIAAITLILALLLCGCSPDPSEAAASVPISIDEAGTTVEDTQVPPYYSVEYFPASAAFAEASTYIWQEGQVLCALTGGANDDYERSLCWADPYSGDAQEILSLSGSEAISCYCIGTDGRLYTVVSGIVEDALDGPEDTGLTWDGCSSSRLVCMDAGGQPLYELPLDQDGATRYTDIAANAAG